ncbi:substrate-binding domain-containing protein, partial [Enterobacter sichuanensis]
VMAMGVLSGGGTRGGITAATGTAQCAADEAGGTSGETKRAANVTIGSAIYKFDDTFITVVRTAMTDQATAEGIELELVDSQNKQPTQNEQVDTFITKGVTALAINPVDRTAAGPIIEKAKAKSLPIVFLNREPEETDMKSYDKVWYV